MEGGVGNKNGLAGMNRRRAFITLPFSLGHAFHSRPIVDVRWMMTSAVTFGLLLWIHIRIAPSDNVSKTLCRSESVYTSGSSSAAARGEEQCLQGQWCGECPTPCCPGIDFVWWSSLLYVQCEIWRGKGEERGDEGSEELCGGAISWQTDARFAYVLYVGATEGEAIGLFVVFSRSSCHALKSAHACAAFATCSGKTVRRMTNPMNMVATPVKYKYSQCISAAMK